MKAEEISKLTADAAADLLMERLKIRNTKGHGLDAGNTGVIAYMWNQIVHANEYYVAVHDQLMNNKSDSYKLLLDKDKGLFLMMRAWLQSNEQVKAAIQERCDELEEIARLSIVAGIDVPGVTETFKQMDAVKAAEVSGQVAIEKATNETH